MDDYDTSRAYFVDFLNQRSLKATNGRINLLLNMQKYQVAMPYSNIQKVMTDVDRVTLYRTLNTLVKKGIIHEAYRENNETYYALCGNNCTSKKHNHEHIHFKCNICKLVTCEELSHKIEIELPEHEIHHVSIHVQGICQKCRNSDPSTNL